MFEEKPHRNAGLELSIERDNGALSHMHAAVSTSDL